MIRIYLVDDNADFINGMMHLFRNDEDIEVVGFEKNPIDFLNYYKPSLCDIILMDIRMPEMDGLNLAEIIINNNPMTKVVILTLYFNFEILCHSIEVGAKAYVPKNTTLKELKHAIQRVYEGHSYYSPPPKIPCPENSIIYNT
ncbi:MAG: hypothetical protein AUJ98_05465 [Bacteroidetes bacterium CG2_30_33_31]|nr:MAG: hypothetical protein AUJ98_05465 [Bacteroidetes bacterium CG2_30_33_31]